MDCSSLQQLCEQHHNSSTTRAQEVGKPSKHLKHPLTADAQVQRCPLDLSLKRASKQSKRRQARQALPALDLSAQPEALKLDHDGLLSQQVAVAQLLLSSTAAEQARLISSSTSPSTCSRSASSSASVSSTLDAGKSVAAGNEVISSSDNSAAVVGSHTKLKPTSQHANSRRQRHKSLKSHLCRQCGRTFARSDMLTRHSRLHSGLKPYQCGKCKQVFSRSDHLSTHERTHTGEKPYQCQHCAYSACRRDMITRHMRTHSVESKSTSRKSARGPRTMAMAEEEEAQPSPVSSTFNDISSSFQEPEEQVVQFNNIDF